MSIIHDLVSDTNDLNWEELAACYGIDLSLITKEDNIFFDKYETDEVTARETDNFCLSCPVIKQCFEAGVEKKSEGIWGGVYLSNGKPSKNYNRHKTDEVWADLKKALGKNVKV
jgi:hypothetical protein